MKKLLRFDTAIVLAVYMAWVAVISVIYPVGGDDFSATEVAARGFFGQFHHDYFHWSVRTGCIFSYFPLIFGKIWFDILNPFVQAALVVLAWLAAFGRLPRRDDRAEHAGFIMLTVMFAFFLARPRDTMFWMCGATNYSWGMLPVLGFVALMRRGWEQGKAHWAALIALGAAAGFANENIAAVGGLALVTGVIYCRRKKLTLPKSVLAGAVAFIAGGVAMFTAPGVWVRAQSTESGMQAAGFVGRIMLLSQVLAFWGAAMPMVLLILGLSALKLKGKLPRSSLVFAAGSLLLALAFAGAGVLPAMRSYYSSTVMMAMAAVVAATAAFRSACWRLPLRIAALAGLLIAVTALCDITAIRDDAKRREVEVAEAHAAGERNPVFAAHRTYRKNFFQYIYVEDISADPDFFVNRLAAQYYGFDTVRADRDVPKTGFYQAFRNLLFLKE
ncbi:MAG: DUF6056 family protein [Victivallaceae bacterium]|nr:DUF6056 family protein [Victivallaceae bacterium]